MHCWALYYDFLLGGVWTESTVDMKEVVTLLPSPGVDSGPGAVAQCLTCNFLPVGPMTCCSNSHTTCCLHGARCRVCSEPLLSPSAHALNLHQMPAAAPAVQSAQFGFHERLPLPQLAAHQHTCEHRPLQCLVAPDTCSWQGRRADLEAHTQAAHPHQFVRFPSTAGTSVSWRISKNGCCVDLTRHLIVALGETFLYQKKFSYQERQLYIALQLLGPLERSRRFRYKFELTRNEGTHTVTFAHVVHSEYEDLQQACGLGDCIKVPYDTISQFCHGERVLVLCKTKQSYKHEVEITYL